MKTRYYIPLILIAAFACQNRTTNLFTETPTQRWEDKETALREQLIAPAAGYKVLYFPNNQKYGGFLFYMKFNTDGTVQMTSNVDNETAVLTSSYEVQFGSTVELNFSSYNHIHKLSDSGSGPNIGTGYEGNSTFQYQRIQDGKIYFKEYRRNADIVFEPVADMAEWDTVKQLIGNTSPIESYIRPDGTKSVFQIMTVNNGSTSEEYSVVYDPERKYVRLESNAEGGSDIGSGFGLAYDQTGATISPPLEIGGAALSRFEPDANGDLLAASGNVSARITFYDGLPSSALDKTAILREEIASGRSLFTGVYYYSDLNGQGYYENNFNSLGFNTLLRGVRSRRDYILFNISLTVNPSSNAASLSFERYDFSSNQFITIVYLLTYEIKDKLLFLTFDGIGISGSDPNGDQAKNLQARFQPMLDFFTGPKGLYFYTSGQSYRFIVNRADDTLVYDNNGRGASYTNIAGTLTSIDQPTLRMYFLFG